LLGDGEFQARWHSRGGGDSGDGGGGDSGGGRSGGRGRGSGSSSGIVHLNVRTVLSVRIRILGTIASHVALGSTSKAVSFGSVPCTLLVRKFLKW
jgi:hypothetical protein